MQKFSDVPLNNEWLGASEKTFLNNLKFPKRRNDWRLGRWTAKCALSACLEKSHRINKLNEIEIIAGEDGAPEAFLNTKPCEYNISISHREGIGFCAIVPATFEIGCDLEMIEPRTLEFISDYFITDENKLIDNSQPEERPLLANLIWSAKESAMKLLREGLRIDTRSVIVNLPEKKNIEEWQPLSVLHTSTNQNFLGWWRDDKGYVLTIVADPPPEVPIELNITPS